MTVEVDMEEAVELRAAAEGGRRRRAGAVVQRLRDQGVRARAARTSRAPTAPTATASSSSTRASTSASRSPGQDALVVPTVFDADQKSLGEIAGEARGLAERVREGKITPPELSARHVHRLQPRHVRHPALRGRDQPAAGGDPRRRRARRRGRSCATARSWSRSDHGAHAHLRPPHPLRRRRRRSSSARIREYLEIAADGLRSRAESRRASGRRLAGPARSSSTASTGVATGGEQRGRDRRDDLRTDCRRSSSTAPGLALGTRPRPERA